jgi:hypothetical protein
VTGPTWQPPGSAETPLYGDAAIVAASGLALPSLRVMQSAGAIRAEKEPKEHGGFRRMWPETDVLKAAVAAAMSEHFAWNIRVVAEAMAKTKAGTWEGVIAVAIADLEEDKSLKGVLVTASEQDCFLELIDRKFLFLKAPEYMAMALPDTRHGQTDLLLGYVKSKNIFQMLPWLFETSRGRDKIKKLVGPDAAEIAFRLYKVAKAAHGNFLSKATINISMQVRAAWRRLHGLEARFVQEIVQPR